MKSYLYIFLALFLSLPLLTQAKSIIPNNYIGYQASIRDAAGKPVNDSAVYVKASILKGTASPVVVYSEEFTVPSDANGLINLELGTGTTISGDFTTINWADSIYSVKTETAVNGDTITSVSQLTSVPYALMAKTIEPIASDTRENGDLLTYDGTNWVPKKMSIEVASAGGAMAHNNMQPFLVLNYCISISGIYPSRSSENPFMAEIELFAFSFAPKNYALCNGQLMPINMYQALFSLLGTNFGGDGRTTFALPDLKGRVAMDFSDNYTLGYSGGEATTSIPYYSLPIHSHPINVVYE
ncbi:MAG: tail fiber protein [Muribaculaceae bacterium]|jgi:microcystin-dependent protein|nr:tail fiber protein [Muribaculaceae bacterium]